jgi:hypothetical protein
MENSNEYPENEKNQQLSHEDSVLSDDNDTEFENPSVDPGFESQDKLTSREDTREGNIDSNLSISEMQKRQQNGESQDGQNKQDKSAEKDPAAGQQNDALNYQNDRENGAYNPKNI